MSEQDIEKALGGAEIVEGPKLNVIGYAELLDKRFEPLRWVLPDLLPEGLCLLVGAPKVGKSWMALGLCVSVAFGEAGPNQKPVEKGDVLYLALEDSQRRLRDRLLTIQTERRRDDVVLDLVTEIPRAHAGGLALVEEWLEGHPGARLVVVDTLQRFRETSTRGAETYASDYEALAPLQKLALNRRVALVLLHHTRKADAKDPFDRVSGTTAILGAADCAWLLERGRGDADGKLNITGRDVDEHDLALRFDKATCQWRVVGNAAEVAASDEERETLECLWDFGKPVSPATLAREMGIPVTAVKMRLKRMVDKGKILKSGHGQYVHPGHGNRVTPGNTGDVTTENRTVIPFPLQSNKVTEEPPIEPGVENHDSEEKCYPVTFEPEPLLDKQLGGNTPPVTGCYPVTLKEPPASPAPSSGEDSSLLSVETARFGQLSLLEGALDLE